VCSSCNELQAFNLEQSDCKWRTPSHAVPRHYLGVLYFQNVIRFQITRVSVNSFTSITKVRPSCPDIHENVRAEQHFVQISYTDFHINHTIYVATVTVAHRFNSCGYRNSCTSI
jgi:hypothetical protein